MEFETTSNGFILEVDGEHGPAIEWMAKEGELIILLPTCDKHGRLDRDGKSYVVRVKRHARMSPSVSVYPLEYG